jgi:hypothetical protein
MRQPLSLVAVTSFLLVACDVPDDAEESKSALTSVPCGSLMSGQCFDYVRGQMTIRIKSCWKVTFAAGPHTVTCFPEPGFVTIGGGGNVVGTPIPGALMTGSYLTADDSWAAAFKNHHSSNGYTIQSHMIGIKFAAVSYAQLKSLRRVTTGRSTEASASPFALAGMPTGHKLVGGGGYLEYGSNGLLLTTTQPFNFGSPTLLGWMVAGKKHIDHDTGFAVAQSISLPSCFGNVCLTSFAESVESADVETGYATATMAPFGSNALTSIGGTAVDDGVGRFLTHLVPYVNGSIGEIPGVFAGSKDRSLASAGSTYARVMSLVATLQ